MASLNKVFLIGNLTRDPEVRYTPSGKAVGDLRLAVNRSYTTADGQTKDETCFVNVVVWGRQAETVGEYLGKGSPVFVEGRLQYEEWEKDGQKQNRLRVVAERVQFIGAPKGGGGEGRGGGPRRQAPQQEARPPEDAGAVPEEPAAAGDKDDLPF